MRLAVLTALLGIVVLATGAVACGDSSGNGGTGGSGNGGTGGNGAVDCLATDWDCTKACSNLDTLCNDSTCSGTQDCGDPDCVASCTQAKSDVAQIPEPQRKLVTGLFNCLEANNVCLSFASCTGTCTQ